MFLLLALRESYDLAASKSYLGGMFLSIGVALSQGIIGEEDFIRIPTILSMEDLETYVCP